MKANRLLAGALAAILGAGCATVGPDFERPEATVDAEWIDANRAEIDGSAGPDPEWWSVFGDAELNALIETAYQQNQDLRAAAIRIYEARAILGVAKGSRYPQTQAITGSAATNRSSRNAPPLSNLPGNVTSNIDLTNDFYQVGFDAAWELDFWGRFRRGIESAEAGLAASVADYDDVLVILMGEVAATYVAIRILEERLAVANQNVTNQARGLEIAEVRFNGGLTTALDVHQASALLSTTRASVASLEAKRRQAQNALAVLLGSSPGDVRSRLGGLGSIPETPSVVAVGMPAELLRRRPDVVRAEMLAAAQSARIGIARADMYPAFSLGGGIGLAAASSGDLSESDSRVSTGFAGVYWPIFNYGRLRNRTRAEDARLEEALAVYQGTVLTAAREVEDALVGFVMAQEETRHLSRAVADAEAALKLAEIMYEEGAVDYTRVLTAQQGLLAAQDAHTSSRGDVALNLVSAYKALGGGWEYRVGKDVLPETARQSMQERTNWGDLLEGAEPPR